MWPYTDGGRLCKLTVEKYEVRSFELLLNLTELVPRVDSHKAEIWE